MTRQLEAGLLGVVLTVLACGSASREVDRLADACQSTSNLGPEICECAASKAKEELSENAFDMLLAMVEEDEAKAAELRGKLDMSDVMAAGMFMTRVPGQCAGELEGN